MEKEIGIDTKYGIILIYYNIKQKSKRVDTCKRSLKYLKYIFADDKKRGLK